MNLINLMGAVLISVIIAIGVLTRPSDPYTSVMLNAIKEVDGSFTGASNTATANADGATIRFVPNGQAGTTVTVFAGRPDSATQPPITESYTIPNVTITTADGTATFRVIVAHDGSGTFIEDTTQTANSWQLVSTTPAACTTATLRFGNGTVWKTGTVSCTSLSVTAD
jgi:hypothetical protein